MSRLLALLLLLVSCCLPAALALPSSFRVLDYETRLAIEANGDIDVTETITIDIPTSGTNKGIIRDIPVNPRWQESGRSQVHVRVESVSIDGKACPVTDQEREGSVLSIYMRDRAHYLDAGEHRFRLRYRISEQVGFFAEQDELTWNAVGEGWEGGVQKARAILIPPPGAEFTQHRAWLGGRGSHDSPVRVRRKRGKQGEVLIFEAGRPLREGEIFTCAVAWPKGVVSNRTALAPSGRWGYTLGYALLFVLAVVAAHRLWARYGRDPQLGEPIPLYYPPKLPEPLRAGSARGRLRPGALVHGEEYMTPAAVHYIHRGGEFSGQGLAALFLSLAQRGDCRLKGKADRGYRVEKLACTTPAPEERAALEAMPGMLLLLEQQSVDNPVGAVHEACEESLARDYQPQSAWCLWPQLLLLAGLALLLWLLAGVQLGGRFTSRAMESAAACMGTWLLLAAGASVLAVWIYHRLKRRRYGSSALRTLCLACIVGGIYLLGGVSIPSGFSTLQLLLMFGALAAPLFYCFLMDVPTREQVALQREIDGLALYIGTAETQRFNFANPPQEDLSLYHRLLPYAVALGLEDAWGRRFAAQLSRAIVAGEERDSMFCSRSFTHGFVNCTHRSYDAYSAAVVAAQRPGYSSPLGGSSFGGFGGGAGSGGGGGGGRAC